MGSPCDPTHGPRGCHPGIPRLPYDHNSINVKDIRVITAHKDAATKTVDVGGTTFA